MTEKFGKNKADRNKEEIRESIQRMTDFLKLKKVSPEKVSILTSGK